jgi:hypothetical protein
VSDRVFAALDRIGIHSSSLRSHLVIPSSLPSTGPPRPVPPRALSHTQLPLYLTLPSAPHVHSHSPLLFPPLPLPHCSPPPPMHHIVTWVGLRHKVKAQQKSAVRGGTSTSQPKGESEKKKDAQATAPCHLDLGSGHVTPLNHSMSRSNDEDVTTCNDDSITGRYLLRLAPLYNRQTDFSGPYHSNSGDSDANFSLSDFSGLHLSHLATH